MRTHDLAQLLRRTTATLWPETAAVIGLDDVWEHIAVAEDQRSHLLTTWPRVVERLIRQPADAVARRLIEQWPDAIKNRWSQITVEQDGTIRLTLKNEWLVRQVGQITVAAEKYFRNDIGHGQKISVLAWRTDLTQPESHTALRHIWWSDALAAIFSSQGYRVKKYLLAHDCSSGLDILTESVMRRYWQRLGFQMNYPEKCLSGQYVITLAEQLDLGDVSLRSADRLRKRIRGQLRDRMLDGVRQYITTATGQSSHELCCDSQWQRTDVAKQLLATVQDAGLLRKRDGRLFVEKPDDPTIEPILLIDAEKRSTPALGVLRFIMSALQHPTDRLILLDGGPDALKDSLDWLLERFGWLGRVQTLAVQTMHLVSPTGADEPAAAYPVSQEFLHDGRIRCDMLRHEPERQLEMSAGASDVLTFSPELHNVQYAYDQIWSILALKETRQAKRRAGAGRLVYEQTDEWALIWQLARLPDELSAISRTLAVHRLGQYLTQLAESFQRFERSCPVLANDAVSGSRIELLRAVKITLRYGCKLLGYNIRPTQST